MEAVLWLLWFFGAGGAVAGACAGVAWQRRGGLWIGAFWWGVLVGALAGAAFDLWLIHDVRTSTSSTAVLGYLAVPFPPVTNLIAGAAAGVFGHLLGRRWAERPPAPPLRSHP